MTANAVFIHHPEASTYRFSDHHPFNPQRLTLTIDLLKASSALEDHQMLVPQAADISQLRMVHRSDYIEAVKALSVQNPDHRWTERAQKYGLQSEDTPYFYGMHAAASILVGGSIQAAEAVLSGQTQHAFHMAGGLHHAFPDHGSGFCVYNDAAVAIAHIRQKYGARVLYIDTDVHHGDGVQWTFYDDPEVCTYSIHETGKYLFPGTGFVHEKGVELGFGACFNLPMEPYTEDDSWLECFSESIEKITAAHKPDIIISQHGCDAHAFDPLSHIHCSMKIYREMPAIIHRLAHQYTQGRWIAVGGGGYDIWRVVPRAWSLVWLEMSGHPIISQLDQEGHHLALPDEWVKKWSQLSPDPLPATWLDNTAAWQPMPRRSEITTNNQAIKKVALQDI
ncbi:acetoin utilization protein AcuC [Paenibacillus abyssi]|uniref:Acetoin utilization protein AcuC n=1 Tax=Paenibacillus abyssi TaxID=1340531 RepID=A0A917FX03_9BACL|nr:acetoin utilization protein AcuC [Paenibacillus abyssi]GGG09389.1 acetoin utilization protein AcuC [Paenibacillus abyssi]